MPASRKTTNTATVEDINHLHEHFDERVERLETLFQSLYETTSYIRELLENNNSVEPEHIQQLYNPVADLIPKPSRAYGKGGFIAFLQDHLPELSEDQCKKIYCTVSEHALQTIQAKRRDHQELLSYTWSNLHQEYKAQMADETLALSLRNHPELAVIRRCRDLWPCLMVLQPKWSHRKLRE